MHAQLLNCVQYFVTSLTVACQAPLSMESSRHWQADSLPLKYLGSHIYIFIYNRCNLWLSQQMGGGSV